MIAAVLLALGAVALARRAHRPAAARPHGPHRGRDRRRRPLAPRRPTTDPRTEVGRLGDLAQRDARPARARVRRAPGERGPAAHVPRRRLARAAHAAGVDPRLRRAVPDGRASPTTADVASAMQRIEDEAARMGVLVEDLLTLARLDEVADAPARRRRRRAARARRRRRRARDRAGSRDQPPRPQAPAIVLGDARPAAPGARATCCATRSCTRRGGTPVEVARRARRRAASGSRSATTGPGLPDGDPERAVRALLARRGRARARQGRRRPRASRSSPRSSTPTAAAVDAGNAPDGGARFVVELPARRPSPRSPDSQGSHSPLRGARGIFIP